MSARNPFNEDSLDAEIVRVWGRYGAHSDVFCTMRRRVEEASVRAERWEHLVDELAAAIQEAAEFPGNAQRRDVITATALAAYRTEKEGNK